MAHVHFVFFNTMVVYHTTNKNKKLLLLSIPDLLIWLKTWLTYVQGENIHKFPTLTERNGPESKDSYSLIVNTPWGVRVFKVFSFSILFYFILNIKWVTCLPWELKKKNCTPNTPKRMKNGFRSKFLSPVSRNSFHHGFFFSHLSKHKSTPQVTPTWFLQNSATPTLANSRWRLMATESWFSFS